MKNIHKKLLCTTIAATLSAGALAQDELDSGLEGIEEIVVTARKKSERMQDVPLSITAMNEAMLDKAGIANMGDIADFTPGFDFAQAFGRQDFRPAIRGQSTIQGGANAGLFIDGIYVGEGGPTFPTSALERVEVVKGPQSTLYGRATLAGAINYVLKRPTQEFEGEVSVTAGQYGETRTDLTLSGPLNEKVGYMVAGSFYKYDGQYSNNFQGNDLGAPANTDKVGGEQTGSLVASLAFQASETFDGKFTVIVEQSNDDPYAIGLLDSANNNCAFGPAPNPPAGTPGDGTTGSAYNNSGYYCGKVSTKEILDANDGKTNLENSFYKNMGTEFRAVRTGLTLNWDLGDLTLSSKTGVNDYRSEARQDQGFGGSDYYVVTVPFPPFQLPNRFGFLTDSVSDSRELGQELTLRSDDTQAFNWMLGVSYYDAKGNAKSRNSSQAGLVDTAPDEETYPLLQGAERTTTNMSYYGAIGYDINEQLTLDAELRYSSEKVAAKGGTADLDFSNTYNAVLPRVNLSWKVTDDSMLYTTVSKGNKPGDINTASDLTDLQREVEEENATNFEVGYKSSWLDNRLVWNSALYYIDWQDQQLTTTTTGASGSGAYSILANLGKTEIKGLETDFTLRATDFWDVYLGYAYTDSNIKEFRIDAEEHASPNGMLSGYEEAAQQGFPYAANGDVIISGTELPQVSKHQATLSNTFYGQLNDDWGWLFRADLIYRSKRYAQVYNQAHTGDSTKLNLRAGFNRDNLDIELWVNNATDDDTSPALIRYVQTANGFFTFGPDRAIAATLPEKRAAGVTVNFRF